MNNSIIIIYFIFIVLMAVFMFYNRRRRAQQAQQTTQQMQPGVEVITIGGLHGVIESIDDTTKTVTLDLEGVKVVFELAAIRAIAPNPVLNKPATKTRKATTKKK